MPLDKVNSLYLQHTAGVFTQEAGVLVKEDAGTTEVAVCCISVWLRPLHTSDNLKSCSIQHTCRHSMFMLVKQDVNSVDILTGRDRL